MGISGNLKTMALAELLQWLSMGAKTGTLVINGKTVEKKIFFANGAIISSASTDPAEYLGRFLASHGFIPEDTIDAAVAQQKSEQLLLGKILVNMGAISEEDLHQMLRLKAEESIYDIFTWEEGEFEFLDDVLPTQTMIRMHLDVQGIVLEGSRRVDEWMRIRESVPSDLCVPVSVVPDFAVLDIEEIDKQLLAWVNDDRTVEEISHEAQVSLFQVASLFAEQVQAQTLKMVRPRTIEVRVEVEVPAEGTGEIPQLANGMQQQQQQAVPAMQQQAAPAMQQFAPNMGVAYPQHPHQQQQQPPQQQQQQQQYPQNLAQMPYAQTPGVAAGSGRTLHYATNGADAAAMGHQQPQVLQAAQPSSEADRLLKSAQEALARGDLEACLITFRKAKTAQGSNATIQSAVETGEKSVQQALERDGVNLSSVPKLECGLGELTKLDISPQEGFMLTRVDGSFDLKSILKMSPMPQVDAQLFFWRLRKLGHVKL